MPVVKNNGGDLNFPGVSLKRGANMVAPSSWEALKADRAVSHYLTTGRLEIDNGQGEAPAPKPPKKTVEVQVETPAPVVADVETDDQEITTSAEPATADFSSMSARELADMVSHMGPDELDQLESSGEERKTVLKAIDSRRGELAGDHGD